MAAVRFHVFIPLADSLEVSLLLSIVISKLFANADAAAAVHRGRGLLFLDCRAKAQLRPLRPSATRMTLVGHPEKATASLLRQSRVSLFSLFALSALQLLRSDVEMHATVRHESN